MKGKQAIVIGSVFFIAGALAALSYIWIMGPNIPGGRILGQAGHKEGELREETAKKDHEDEPADKDEGRVRFSKEEMKELGIQLSKAGPGTLRNILSLPGEILLNDDRVASVIPYVSGYVTEVRKSWHDQVRRGEVMAVLASRDLADAKAAFLAARERVSLAGGNFSREEGLWKKKISSEQDYLEAKQALASAEIEMRSSRQKLMALGLSNAAVERVPEESDALLTRYEIVSPLDGEVLEKKISLGEMVKSETAVYRVANLDSVWVKVNVYQKDMGFLRKGEEVVISAGQGIPDARGTITFIGPLVGETTRTAHAQVLLPNPNGQWRPGLFVNAEISTAKERIPLWIPQEAVATLEGRMVVFIPAAEGFKPKTISTGRSDRTHVEVVAGLSPGDPYVAKGAFEIKAAITTGSLGAHAGHGH